MHNTKLRIVIFQEGEWLCAHCLEYDFATQAKNLDDLRYDLERIIVGHIAVSLPLPQQSFGLKIKKRGVKIPTPEIRVAPLGA